MAPNDKHADISDKMYLCRSVICRALCQISVRRNRLKSRRCKSYTCLVVMAKRPGSRSQGEEDSREVKRPRAELPYDIESCCAEIPSEQPELCTVCPLQERQLRSLTWMLRREDRTVLTGDVQRECGGVLLDVSHSDAMGTAIGLISKDPESLPVVIGPTADGRVSCGASLILCPSERMEEWVQEFQKRMTSAVTIVQTPRRINTSPKLRVQGSGPRKILVIYKARMLEHLKIKDFLQYHAVIVPYTLWAQHEVLHEKLIYQGLVSRVLCQHNQAMEKKSDVKLRQMLDYLQSMQNWTDLMDESLPLLEMFNWKRIIFDECTEAGKATYVMRSSLRQLRAQHRWGLSRDGAAVADHTLAANIAVLLGYTQLPESPTLAALKAASALAQVATSNYGWQTTWQKQRANDEVSRESTANAVRDFISHCVRHHHSMEPALVSTA